MRDARQRLLRCALALAVAASPAAAGIDWGGGDTRFEDRAGAPLGREAGCAVLLSVVEGGILDFATFAPERPSDLVTPGRLLRDGESVNRVVATTCAFYSGYLLNSAIPDLSAAAADRVGVSDGERLFVMVWDTRTFREGAPTDGSRFTLAALYEDGDTANREARFRPDSPVFARVVYPDETSSARETSAAARYAGLRTYHGFGEWLAAEYPSLAGDIPAAATADPDGDGRNLLETYVLGARKSGEVGGGGESGPGAGRTVARVRAGDTGVRYGVAYSTDLRRWETAPLEFAEGVWRSGHPRVGVGRARYEGRGVWLLELELRNSGAEKAAFFKVTGARDR